MNYVNLAFSMVEIISKRNTDKSMAYAFLIVRLQQQDGIYSKYKSKIKKFLKG